MDVGVQNFSPWPAPRLDPAPAPPPPPPDSPSSRTRSRVKIQTRRPPWLIVDCHTESVRCKPCLLPLARRHCCNRNVGCDNTSSGKHSPQGRHPPGMPMQCGACFTSPRQWGLNTCLKLNEYLQALRASNRLRQCVFTLSDLQGGGDGFRGQSTLCGKPRISNWPRNFPREIQGLLRNFPHTSGRFCGLWWGGSVGCMCTACLQATLCFVDCQPPSSLGGGPNLQRRCTASFIAPLSLLLTPSPPHVKQR